MIQNRRSGFAGHRAQKTPNLIDYKSMVIPSVWIRAENSSLLSDWCRESDVMMVAPRRGILLAVVMKAYEETLMNTCDSDGTAVKTYHKYQTKNQRLNHDHEEISYRRM